MGSTLGLVIVVYLTVDAVFRGQWGVAVRWLPWMLGALWLVFTLTAASRLVVTDDVLTVQNYLRRHRIAWGAVRDITSRRGLTLHLDTGQAIVCAAVPTLRPGPPLTRMDQSRGDAARALITALDQRRVRASSTSGSEVTREWDRTLIVTAAFLAAACIITLLLPAG